MKKKKKMKVLSDTGWVEKKPKYSIGGKPIKEIERIRFITFNDKP
jgi:hypothetical protein